MTASFCVIPILFSSAQALYVMVPESTAATAVDNPAEEDGMGTLIHAVIGAVAGTVLSFIPLSPLLGGAVAGYLEGGETDTGLKVGGIAGIIMLIPFVFIGMFIMMFLLGFGPGGSVIAFGAVAVVMFLVSAFYTVGLSIVGGYLGIYLKNER